MAIRTILHYPDPRLRVRAEPVTEITPEIRTLIEDMAETMYSAAGAGLAAPQIGVPLQIYLFDAADENEKSDLRVFINPEIIEVEGEVISHEGCLSFPGSYEEIKRSARVKVRALDGRGQTFELDAEGLLAVGIQHEGEHLKGILMIDHLGPLKKRLLHRKMVRRAS